MPRKCQALLEPMVPSPQSMWRAWLFLGCLVAVAAFIAWRTGGSQRLGQALTSASGLFVGVLPNLILGFILAGFLHVLIPQEWILTLIGPDSGLKGLLTGSVAGMLMPGGPFVHFPILASFLSKGAGIGPVAAYIAAWALIGVNRFIVWELPILGPKVAFVRFAASFAIPPFVGYLSALLYRLFHVSA